MLFAVHLADGFVTAEWAVIGYAIAIGLAVLGAWRLDDRDIPRIALATAVFFVASSIHIPVPGTSVHLVLNGLVGILLGGRAGLALFVGLFLQCILIGHGGITALGDNVVVQAIPAILAGVLFRFLAARPGMPPTATALIGGLLSAAAVLAAVGLQSVLIRLASTPQTGDTIMPAALWFAVHLPVAAIEAFAAAAIVGFLLRVRPDLLGLPPRPRVEAGEKAQTNVPQQVSTNQ